MTFSSLKTSTLKNFYPLLLFSQSSYENQMKSNNLLCICNALLVFLAILSEMCNFLQAHGYFIHEVENLKKQKQT